MFYSTMKWKQDSGLEFTISTLHSKEGDPGPSMVTNKQDNANDNLKEPNMVTKLTNNLIKVLKDAQQR